MSRNNLTNTTTTTIAVAADYADAMMTARTAKNVLFLLLLLVLLTQVSLFFLLRFGVIRLGDEVAVEQTSEQTDGATQASGNASTQPGAATQAVEATAEADASGEATDGEGVRVSSRVEEILRYVIPVTDFLGVTMAVVLAVVLLLIVTIMLIGRLIGVSHVTSAFVWCVVLAVLLFPWQAFLLDQYRPAGPAGEGEEQLYVRASDPTFKIPGALYTWEELRRDYDFEGDLPYTVLKWFRFAVAPVLALLLLMMVQARSSRGLKYALGESEVQVEVSSPRL